jgi:hypothetical protein
MPYSMAPCLLGWMWRFCTVRGWSRHDLAMIWERYTAVLHLVYIVFGDFASKLEVHMHVSYADFYECYVYLQYYVPSCQRCHALSLSSPGVVLVLALLGVSGVGFIIFSTCGLNTLSVHGCPTYLQHIFSHALYFYCRLQTYCID